MSLPFHPTSLVALEGNLRFLQNEHRATIEALEVSKSAQQEELRRTNKENQQLRDRLQQLHRTLAQLELHDRRDHDLGTGGGQQQLLQQEVDQARKESDELKVQSLQLKKELEGLKDQVRTLDLQLRPPGPAAGVAAASWGRSGGPSDLEAAIERAVAQHSEAQQIRATYEQIVLRLKGERVGFDQQIAALERTLAVKRHDLELVLLSAEAGRARDAAQQELGKRKAVCEQEQAQREDVLREKQQLLQQRVRRRKEALRAATTAARSSADREGAAFDEEGGGAGSDIDADGHVQSREEEDEEEGEEEAERLAEGKQRLEGLQQVHRRVKDVLGVATVEGVVEKLATQATTLESLGTASRDNQARLERLQVERDALHTAVERSRFAPKPTRSQEDVAAELARDQERLAQLQLKHQQLAKLLKGIECSTQHLLHQLRPVVPLSLHAPASPASPPPSAAAGPEQQAAAGGVVRALQDIEQVVQSMQPPQA